MSKSVIAIDLGSNSLRILKMNCETKERIAEFHKTVKTADKLASTGIINNEALNRIIIALNEAKDSMEFSGSTIKAVTTEAIRQAKNSEEILAKIKDETGIVFEVIDGIAEAKYALVAVENRLKILGKKPKSFMLVDIGGGSTELLFHYGEEKSFSKSFQIGIVTVTQKFKGLAEIAEAMPILMNPLKNYYNEVVSQYGEVELFIATAGTPTTIAAMKQGMEYATYDAEKIHGTLLSREDLITQLSALISMNSKDRVRAVGVGRDDLIASGVLIYDELYTISGFRKSMVIDDGIREGIAFSFCESDS
jgi:exopolyphosphatase/guanosine-5'-triphosphate,3'-diphosphate pyrophosphatase